MKNNTAKRAISACLIAVMTFLMLPFGIVEATAKEGNDYSVPTTEHNLLSSYNIFSGIDISTNGSTSALGIFKSNKLSDLIDEYSWYDSRHSQYGEEFRGETMESFALDVGVSLSASFGTDVGISELFKVSESKKFSLSVDVSYKQALESYFYEYQATVQTGYYRFEDSQLSLVRDDPDTYLADAFLKALTGTDGSTPEEFFEEYGTHLVTGYTAGGKAGVYSSTIKTNSSASASVSGMYETETGASATIDGIEAGGKTTLSALANVKANQNNSNYKGITEIYAHGGTEAVILDSQSFEFKDWANSIDESNAVILVDEQLKLVPIWNLIPTLGNEKRILELTTAYIELSEKSDNAFYEKFGIDNSLFDYSRDWLNFESCKIITNEQELYDIRKDLNGVYVLANNITLDKYSNWTPIGSEEEPFRGRLYGNHNTVSGLNITDLPAVDSTEKAFIGLFGWNDGLISDLRIRGNIEAPHFENNGVYIGAIAAYNAGIVSNCADEVSYDVTDASFEHINLPIESEVLVPGTYTIGDKLGIHLKGDGTNVKASIKIEESNNVGPVFIILENVKITSNSNDGVIFNTTTRPVYIITKGTSNIIYGSDGWPGYPAIKSLNANVQISGNADFTVQGGNGIDGSTGSTAVGTRAGSGGMGLPGSYAVKSLSLSIAVVNDCNVYLCGGNGGQGGTGGYGDSSASAGKGYGGHGGTGGTGSNAIYADSVQYVSGNIKIKGGNGGTGGTGGYGELQKWTLSGNWGAGYGGNGGQGGAGAAAVHSANISISGNAKVTVIGGSGGGGGHPGMGHDRGYASWGGGGNNATPRAELYDGNKRYVLNESKKTWSNAKSSAESDGGYLATITSKEEQLIINELLTYGTQEYYSLGGYRVQDDVNVWAWISGEDFSYVNWNEGQPDNAGSIEDYVHVYRQKLTWNDIPDSTLEGYITEYDLTAVKTNSTISGIVVGYNANEGASNRRYNQAEWNNLLLQVESVTNAEYFDRDSFNNNNIVASFKTNGSVKYGKAYNFTCNDLTAERMGEVIISYTDSTDNTSYTRSVPVHITKNAPDYIYVNTADLQTEYMQDEEFDANGLSVTVVYLNGTERSVDINDLTYTVPSTHIPGVTETVTVTYRESGITRNTTYDINVVEDIVVRLYNKNSIASAKILYRQGEKLDLSDLSIVGVFKSGKEETIPVTNLIPELSTSMCIVGTKTVTLKYAPHPEISYSYDITILENKNFEHPWDNGSVTKTPTHTEEGEKTYTCEECGEIKTESIPPLDGHIFGSWHVYNSLEHQKICACGESITEAHAWNSGKTSVAATHLTEGESIYTCTACGATETRTIPKLTNHSFEAWEIFDGENHLHRCACGEIEYDAHRWGDGEVTTLPTYSTEGVRTYTCSYCGIEKSVTEPKLTVPENAPQLVIDANNAYAGKLLYVRVRLKNNPGITSLRINLTYDNALLSLLEVNYNEAMGGQYVLPENINALDGPLTLYWTNGFANYENDGVFATLVFEVSADATTEDMLNLSINYLAEDIYDVDEKEIEFISIDKKVLFENYIAGDINGDGAVNAKDTTRLMRYLAGWDVEVNESALDVNGDGIVNTKDTTRLMRYLANWKVEIY